MRPTLHLAILSAVLAGTTLADPAEAARRAKAKSTTALTAESVNGARIISQTPSGAALLKLQVLLDRAHFSPGEIDGKLGENTKKAMAAWAFEGEDVDHKLDIPPGPNNPVGLVWIRLSE